MHRFTLISFAGQWQDLYKFGNEVAILGSFSIIIFAHFNLKRASRLVNSDPLAHELNTD